MLGLLLVLFLSCDVVDSDSEFPVVVGDGPVRASAGDDVILSCHLEPPVSVTTLIVEWTWNDLNVLLYRHRKDDHSLQYEQFRNRTSLFHHEMIRGNISLKLTNVTEEDSGVYRCYIPRLNSQVKRGNVLLTVDPRKNPAGRGDDEEEQDADGLPNNNRTGVIIASVLSVLLLMIVVSAAFSFRTLETREEEELGEQSTEKTTRNCRDETSEENLLTASSLTYLISGSSCETS